MEGLMRHLERGDLLKEGTAPSNQNYALEQVERGQVHLLLVCMIFAGVRSDWILTHSKQDQSSRLGGETMIYSGQHMWLTLMQCFSMH